MAFVLFGCKKEMNSYPTLQDEQDTVEHFLNRKAQEAMCCLDTQEPSDDPSTTPDKASTANISNPHDQTVDQLPHTYQASKHEYSDPSVKFPQIVPVMLPHLYWLNMNFL